MKKDIKCVCEVCKNSYYGYSHRPNKFCSRQCCGKAKLGKPTWITGKRAVWMEGIRNHNWKGNNASPEAIHHWIDRRKGIPTKCEHCGFESHNRRKIHWANTKKHNYRKEVSEFIALCVSCHRKYDGFTVAQRKKMSLAKLGNLPWNKGLVGVMKDNGHRFKKGNPAPIHKRYCNCFRCHKSI